MSSDAFYIKNEDHLKLYILLQDKIRFESLLNENNIPFYSNIDEQPDISGGIRYFLLDSDRSRIDNLLIDAEIIAQTETISNYDARAASKLYKMQLVVVIIIVLVFTLILIIESLVTK